MTFALTLAAAMSARCVNVKALADRTGIHPQTISNLRRGLNEPRLRTASLLADALDWAPLAQMVELARRGSCGICGGSFVSDHTSLTRRRFCSHRCQQVAWNRQATSGRERKRARYLKKETMRLREHQQAVEAFCRSCQSVDFICRDAGCELRGVSPLPFIALTRRAA